MHSGSDKNMKGETKLGKKKENKKARNRELRLILLAELFRLLDDQQQEKIIETIEFLLSDE